MAYAIIQVEIERYGEARKRIAREVNFKTTASAQARAAELARDYQEHGFNDRHGFWWYRSEGKHYRLVVEAQQPTNDR